MAPADRADSADRVHRQRELDLLQERRTAQQDQLDQTQDGQNLRQELFGVVQYEIDNPEIAPIGHPDAPASRKLAAQARADAAVRRAESTLIRARALQKRAKDILERDNGSGS